MYAFFECPLTQDINSRLLIFDGDVYGVLLLTILVIALQTFAF